MHCTKENFSGELLIARYTHIKWARFFTTQRWLTDIETASELTGKSRTKLAQAKSRGLVRTLITKVIIAQRVGKRSKTPYVSKYLMQTFTLQLVDSWIFNKLTGNH